MSLNDQISQKAKQSREEAISFEQSLKVEFDVLTAKSNENLVKVNKQIDLLNDVSELESDIANKVSVIAAIFTKNALLENLFNTKLEEKISKFPKVIETQTPAVEPTPTSTTQEEPPKKLASGGVVPGQTLQEKKDKQIKPYAETLTLPLRASGIAALTVLGDFIRNTGSLGAFFSPYVKSVVKPFALALGVTDNIINTLIGGPVQAATLDLENQKKEFGETWGKFLNNENFIFQFIERQRGGEDDDTPYTGEWGAILDLIKKVEAVAHKYNAVNYGNGPGFIEGLTNMTIAEAFKASEAYRLKYGGSGAVGQYQFMTPIDQAKAAGLNPTVDKFSPSNQDKMAVNIIENKRRGKDWKARKISDDEFMVLLAAEWRGLPANPSGQTYQDQYANRNKAHASWEEFKSAVQKVKGRSPQTTAQYLRGGQEGSVTSSVVPYLVSGPDAGYDAVIKGMNVTLHGDEIVVEGNDGFQVYPVRNRRYDIFTDPFGVAKRWKEIAKGANAQNVLSFSSGGSADFWKIAALASKEDSLHPQGQADIAQALYNRAAIGIYPGGKSIGKIITAPGQFEPTFNNAGAWAAIRDRRSAIAAVGNAQKVDMAAKSITNPSLQREAQRFVGGRTDFMGESQKPHMKPGDVTRGPGYNFHGWFYNARLPKPAPVPNMVASQMRSTASSQKPQSKIVVNRVSSPQQPSVVQQIQNSISYIPNLIFNPHKLRREIGMKRSR